MADLNQPREEGWINIDAEEALEAIYAIAPSADSSFVHALSLLVGLLVAEGHEDGYTPFSPVLDVDSPHATEAASAEAAAAAAAAATMGAAAQRTLIDSQARLRLLCAEAVIVSREAAVQRERARAAGARYEVLTDQMNATNASINELQTHVRNPQPCCSFLAS